MTDRLTFDPEMRLETYPHAIAGLWVLGGSMTAAGSAIATARDLLAITPANAVTALAAAPVPEPGDPVFLPDLTGQGCPVQTLRAEGGWLRLTPDTRRDALAVAADGGVAYALRRILDRIEEVSARSRATVRWAEAPGNALLPARATGLPEPWVANVSQVVMLDRDALTERAGRLSASSLELVLAGIDVVLGRGWPQVHRSPAMR